MTEVVWPELDAIRDVVNAGFYVPRQVTFAVALEESSIHPGQPLRAACYLSAPLSAGGTFPFRSANASFTVDGNLLNNEIAIVIDSRASIVRWPMTGLLSLHPAHDDAPTFWRAGEKSLDVEIDLINANGAHIRKTTSAAFTVIAEDVGQRWWRWISPADTSTSAHWKESYLVSGYGHNPSERASLAGRVVLWEQPFDYPPRSPRGESLPKRTNNIVIPPLQSVAVTFDPIIQDWSWLTSVLWIITGDTARTFRYQAKMTVADEFGNEYSLDSDTVDVIVRVSESKFELGKAATFAAASAAVIAITAAAALLGIITAISVPILSAAAAAAYGAAAGFGAAALDPPMPDPRFNERVPIAEPTDAPEADSQIASLMRSASDCLAILASITLVVAKILGAIEAGDGKATILQRKDHRSATDELEKRLAEFRSLMPGATSELSELVNESAFKKAAAEWRLTVVPEEMRDALAKVTGETPDLLKLASLVLDSSLDATIFASSVTNSMALALDHAATIARKST